MAAATPWRTQGRKVRLARRVGMAMSRLASEFVRGDELPARAAAVQRAERGEVLAPGAPLGSTDAAGAVVERARSRQRGGTSCRRRGVAARKRARPTAAPARAPPPRSRCWQRQAATRRSCSALAIGALRTAGRRPRCRSRSSRIRSGARDSCAASKLTASLPNATPASIASNDGPASFSSSLIVEELRRREAVLQRRAPACSGRRRGCAASSKRRAPGDRRAAEHVDVARRC